MNEFEKSLKETLTLLIESQDLEISTNEKHFFSNEYEEKIAKICKEYSLPAKKFAQKSEKSPKITLWHKIAVAFCAVAVCILFVSFAMPVIQNTLFDSNERISDPDYDYVAVLVEENAAFCPSYAPSGFVLYNAEFDDDPFQGGVLSYSNKKGDIITFSYERSSGEILNNDNCKAISIGDYVGYFDKNQNSLTWKENDYILKICGISDEGEIRKMACNIKNKEKVSIHLQTTTLTTNINEPMLTTSLSLSVPSITVTTVATKLETTAPQQIYHTGTFFVPSVTTVSTKTSTSASTKNSSSAMICTTSLASTATTTASSNNQITSQFTTATAASKTTTISTTAQTALNTMISTTVSTTTTTTATTSNRPTQVAAEVKSWRQGYGLSDILLQTETTEFPCMTIVHSMAELEALNGSLYQIDFDNIYSFKCELTEDYLSEEFFYENDFVIILSYETSGNNEYDVQSAKITQDHIFEVTLSHYTPATFTCDMSMQVTGIAVPKGSLSQAGGYSINWEYFGHSSNVPEGNESYTAYENSIPEVLYIQYEFT